MGKVGDLMVSLGADNTNLKKGMNESKNLIQGTMDTLNNMKAELAGISSMVAPLYVAKDWALAVNDLEDKTNMAGEEASKLLAIGQSVGLATDEMAGAVSKMSRNTMTALDSLQKANAAGTESSDVFTKYGISITDASGKLLSAEQILQNATEAHRNMANGVAKTSMEMEIFGRSGTKLNDLLNLSSKQMADTAAMAEKCGLVLDSETTQAFEDAQIEINKSQLAMKGLATQVGAAMLPQLQSLGSTMKNAAVWFSDLTDKQKQTAAKILEVAAALSVLSLALKSYNLLFAPLFANLGKAISLFNTLRVTAGLGMGAAAGALGAVTAVVGSIGYKTYNDYTNYQNGGKATYDDLGNVTIEAPNPADNNAADFRRLDEAGQKQGEAAAKQTEAALKQAQAAADMSKAAASMGGVSSGIKSAATAKLSNGETAVANMRALEGQVNYQIPGGTGCMYAIGKAYAGTGLEGITNMDVAKAKYASLWHDAGDGVAGPGDIVYVNGGNHAVMKTESGGTIQNGASGTNAPNGLGGGIYESGYSPESMNGYVGYLKASELKPQSLDGQSIAEDYAKAYENAQKIKTEIQDSSKSASELDDNFAKALQSTDNINLDGAAKAQAELADKYTAQTAKITGYLEEYKKQIEEAQKLKTEAETTGNAEVIALANQNLETLKNAEIKAHQEVIDSKKALDQQYQTEKQSNYQQYLEAEAELDAAQRSGNLERFFEQLNTEQTSLLAAMEEHQAVMQQYYDWKMESEQTYLQFALEAADTLKNGLASSISDAVLGTKSLSEGLKDVAKNIVAMFIQWQVKKLAAAALSKTTTAAELAAITAFGSATAAALSPAAVAKEIISPGSATAALATVTASMSTAGAAGAIGAGPNGTFGFANGGIVTAPTLAWIGEGRNNEAVLPLTDNNLAKFGLGGGEEKPTPNFTINVTALDAQSVQEFFMKNGEDVVNSLRNQARKFNYGGA